MKKSIGITLGLAIALSLSACGSGDSGQMAAPASAAAASASASIAAHRRAVDADRSSKAAEKSKAKAERKAEADSSRKAAATEQKKYGNKIYKEWLESRGVQSNSELLKQSPGNVQGYLVSAESPVTGTAVFTAQLTENDVDKDELEQAAMAVLQLVGYEDESLDRVEIVTADSLVRGTANRYDSPLLNK